MSGGKIGCGDVDVSHTVMKGSFEISKNRNGIETGTGEGKEIDISLSGNRWSLNRKRYGLNGIGIVGMELSLSRNSYYFFGRGSCLANHEIKV